MTARSIRNNSPRVLADGDDAGVAVSSSSVFAIIGAKAGANASVSLATTSRLILLRLILVCLSDSARAALAPTPNMIPAVAGG